MTDCRATRLELRARGSRRFEADLCGGRVTSDAGLLLLHQVASTYDVFGRFAACFTGYRDPDRIDHQARDLVAQRVPGLCCGYEDQNDHDSLRKVGVRRVYVAISEAFPRKELLARVLENLRRPADAVP